MAFRKSRRLRRNLRKSRKNRNRSRHYRGGSISPENQTKLNNINSETNDNDIINLLQSIFNNGVNKDLVNALNIVNTKVPDPQRIQRIRGRFAHLLDD